MDDKIQVIELTEDGVLTIRADNIDMVNSIVVEDAVYFKEFCEK